MNFEAYAKQKKQSPRNNNNNNDILYIALAQPRLN